MLLFTITCLHTVTFQGKSDLYGYIFVKIFVQIINVFSYKNFFLKPFASRENPVDQVQNVSFQIAWNLCL